MLASVQDILGLGQNSASFASLSIYIDNYKRNISVCPQKNLQIIEYIFVLNKA